MVETNKQNQTVRPGEHYKTPGAMNWFVGDFLAHDEVLGLKVVTGRPLPDLEAGQKKASGKGDLVIGKKGELEATSDGLIELREEIYPINKAQNVLEGSVVIVRSWQRIKFPTACLTAYTKASANCVDVM